MKAIENWTFRHVTISPLPKDSISIIMSVGATAMSNPQQRNSKLFLETKKSYKHALMQLDSITIG